jgi:hypothetical protein
LRTGESTLLNKDGSAYLCLLSDGIGGGPGLSLPPVVYVDFWYDSHNMGRHPCISSCFPAYDKTGWVHQRIGSANESVGRTLRVN